ncbi:MAG: 2,3-bisphosphoglycerate-dependent phosphoglycerate mutase [Solirubrobacteraceae bacterium]
MTAAANLVLVRHGESEFNARGLATGWADVSLTARGREQAAAAGRWLASEGLAADVAFTSMLARARQTTDRMLDAWGYGDITVTELWQLNERHLGQLQGLDKQAIKDRWGNPARRRWRSDFAALPPPLHVDDPGHPRNDPRFRSVADSLLPGSERIADVRRRVLDVWRSRLAPELAAGRRMVVVAHRDTLRLLIAELEGLHDDHFCEIDVPTATPRAYLVCGKARMSAVSAGPTLSLLA